ncbi:uncharacterized protein LOC135209066 isoform X2 [Macrobrachium nipponense]|uniref:uncharacterized protein LOC135209066 isoform X2 n=1 Tax=Macrobrachium nipponense TaxID=159736 RepID=UPI0030C7E4AA
MAVRIKTTDYEVAERKNDIVEAQNHAIAKLQKKENRKRKSLPEEQEDDDAVKVVDILTQAVAYLREIPSEKLMQKTLFDTNVLSDVKKTPDATAEQKAIFQFAADERISTAVQIFREQYPKWKKAKKHLMPKMVENNNLEIVSEKSELVNNEGDMQLLCKKIKKKNKRKAAIDSESSVSPKKIKLDVTNDGNEDSKLPKKKKKKKKKKGKNAKTCTITEGPNSTETGNPPSSGTLEKSRSKKLNAIELVVANGTAALEASNNGSPKKVNQPVKPKGPSHPLPKGRRPKFQKSQYSNIKSFQNNNSYTDEENAEGKGDMDSNTGFQRQGNGFQFRNQGRGGKAAFNNRRSGKNDNGNSSQLPWKVRRFVDKKSANMIHVSSDWQEKICKPKGEGGEGEDEEKPSLLRPSWLTNPEEYKPSFTNSREYGPSFRGRKNFRQQREPSNPNKIRVPSDWKNKSPKKDGDEGTTSGTSLLKPSWLTNPKEHKPLSAHKPAHKKFGGDFKGRLII